MLKPFLSVVLVVALAGCSRHTPSAGSTGTSAKQKSMAAASGKEVSAVLEVAVFKDGTIKADGQPVELDELAKQMEKTKEASGTVLYYREAPDEEPHPNAMKVMALVVANKLPIALSTKPEFSNTVGDDGIAKPR